LSAYLFYSLAKGLIVQRAKREKGIEVLHVCVE
jgi:hypothetical protein